MTTDERIGEIEDRATFTGKEGLAESFYRMNKQIDNDIPFLLALVKMQRRALENIKQRANESGTGEMAERETIYAMYNMSHAALNWKEDV